MIRRRPVEALLFNIITIDELVEIEEVGYVDGGEGVLAQTVVE